MYRRELIVMTQLTVEVNNCLRAIALMSSNTVSIFTADGWLLSWQTLSLGTYLTLSLTLTITLTLLTLATLLTILTVTLYLPL